MFENSNKEKSFHKLPIKGMVIPTPTGKEGVRNMGDISEEHKNKVDFLLDRFNTAKNKRQSYNKIWNDISIYIVPSLNDNFNTSSANTTSYSSEAIDTYIRNSNLVYDATAIIACNKIAGALYSFTNNPSLKWFDIDLPVVKHQNYQAVKNKKTTKEWLSKRRDTLLEYLNKALASCSNTLYNEAIGYGTASVYLRETFDENIMVGKSISLETLYLDEDENGLVSTLFREVELNAINAANKFGKENLHKSVIKNFENKPDEVNKYLHVVAKNQWRILDSKAAKDKKYLDIYIDIQNRIIVHHAGYDEFPYGIARMNVPSKAPYGISPGMMTLPDVKTVNVFEKINIDVGNKAGNPPMHMMADNYITPFSMVPAALNLYNDPVGIAQPIQTIGNVNIMENALERKKQSIKEGFYNDLLTPARGNTTYEVQEEQLLQMKLMAPWQGGFELELYEPLIRRAEGILERVGNILPEPPEDVLELYNGVLPRLSIKHTSPLSLAQKRILLSGIDTTVRFAGGLAQLNGMDSIKIHETIEYYAENSGMPLHLLRDKKEVEALQSERAKINEEIKNKQLMTEEAKQAESLGKASKDFGGLSQLLGEG